VQALREGWCSRSGASARSRKYQKVSRSQRACSRCSLASGSFPASASMTLWNWTLTSLRWGWSKMVRTRVATRRLLRFRHLGLAFPPPGRHMLQEEGMTQTPAPPPLEEPTTRGQRGRYPSQFQRGRAVLVLDQQRTIADVSRELGVNEQTLGNSGAPGTHRPWCARGATWRRARGIGCAASATRVTMEQDLPKRFPALADPGRAARDPQALALLARRPRGSSGAPPRRAGRISRQATTPGLARVTRGPDPAEASLEGKIRAIATDHQGNYGSLGTRTSDRRHGWCVHHKQLERLIGEPGTTPKRCTRTTAHEEDAPIAVLVG